MREFSHTVFELIYIEFSVFGGRVISKHGLFNVSELSGEGDCILKSVAYPFFDDDKVFAKVVKVLHCIGIMNVRIFFAYFQNSLDFLPVGCYTNI